MRRAWRTLHIGTDADTGEIVEATLTSSDTRDASQVGPLLDQVDGPVASFTAYGAYDWDSAYNEVAARRHCHEARAEISDDGGHGRG